MYRHAMSFLISVAEWDRFASLPTARHPDTQYNFNCAEASFLNFSSQLRPTATMNTLGNMASYKSKLAKWKVKKAILIVTHQVQLLGIRVSTVCAWNTSKLAFEGSCEVVRGVKICLTK